MPVSPGPAAVTVVYGATGAGKTALIAHLLALRPRDQRWAVLQNDFGVGDFQAAPGTAEGAVIVRAVSGCVCCTARVALRSGVIELLRAARPQRLLIEASSAAEPRAIAAVLREPGIAGALKMSASLCVVSARHLAHDDRYIANDVYRQQLAAADAIVMGEDAAKAHIAARAVLLKLTQPGRLVSDIAAVDLELLDGPARSDCA